MKKNLLSFIGSILSCITIFLFGAPFLNGQSGSNTYTVSINEAIGVVSNTSGRGQVAGMAGLLLLVAIIFAFVNLVIVLSNILSKKSNTSAVLAFSVVQVLAVYFIAKTISSVVETYSTSSYSYSAGWGIIIVLVFFASSFVLCLVQYILDMISLRKKDEDEKYNQIYKLKKLLDDGIITQEDFDEKKAEFLKTLNKESE